MDYFKAKKVLELSDNYSEEELKTQYKMLAKKYHPDNIVSGNEQLFMDVKEAYNYLLTNSSTEKQKDDEVKREVVCPMCDGKGWCRTKIKVSTGFVAQKTKCTACDGTGKRRG